MGTKQVPERILPSSSKGGANSWITGPSGRYILTGTLRMLYAPSRSITLVVSVDIGRAEGGGGELERVCGFAVGISLAATLQKSSKLSITNNSLNFTIVRRLGDAYVL